MHMDLTRLGTESGAADFEGILNGFWEGFSEAKILDFRIFFDVFWKQISNNVLEAKKIEKNAELDGSYPILALDSGAPHAPGEKKRGVQKAS